MNDLATQAKIEAAKAFDEAYAASVSLHDQGYLMNAEERAFLRKEITKHPAWNAYRQTWAIDAASLDKRRVLHFCETNDFDWRDALARHKDAEHAEAAALAAEAAKLGMKASDIGQEEWHAQVKEQERKEEEAYRRQLADERHAADEAKRAEKRAEEAATAAAIAATVIPQVTGLPPASEARSAPVPHFGGDAITQALANVLWTPMLSAIKADMDKTIALAIGELPKTTIEIKRHDGSRHTLPTTHHPMLPTLIRMVSARQEDGLPVNVWVSGPTGSGKSYAAKQVAAALGVDFHVQGAMSQPFELIGFINAAGHYHDTPFRRAFEHGGVILLDEIDAGANEAVLSINGATANGGYSFPDKYVLRHPDCYIIGAANTWGSGPTAEFVGRAKIDDAIMSRFPAKLYWDYDTAFEIRISGNETWARRVQDARRRGRANNVKHLIDPRHTIAGAALIAAGFTSDETAKLTYLAGVKPEQVQQIEGRAI